MPQSPSDSPSKCDRGPPESGIFPAAEEHRSVRPLFAKRPQRHYPGRVSNRFVLIAKRRVRNLDLLALRRQIVSQRRAACPAAGVEAPGCNRVGLERKSWMA